MNRPSLRLPWREREFDVGAKVQPRKERRVLKDHRPVRTWPDDRGAPLEDAPGRGPREPCDQVEDGGLAAARGPDQAHELARRDLERSVPQNLEVALGRGDTQRDRVERDRRPRATGRRDRHPPFGWEAAGEAPIRDGEHVVVIVNCTAAVKPPNLRPTPPPVARERPIARPPVRGGQGAPVQREGG